MTEPIKVETTITKRTVVSGKWIFVESLSEHTGVNTPPADFPKQSPVTPAQGGSDGHS
jgi:hypothetical protein